MNKPQCLVGGLLALGALPFLVSSATAQCVVADVAIQAAIDGSEAPAEQTNDVTIESSDHCVGNTSVHTSRQIHVGGTAPVRQVRHSQHQLNGSQERRTAVQGPTVEVPVGVQVDVYNPANRLQRRR